MLATHYRMEKELKETFNSIDQQLTQQTKEMQSRSFFTAQAKNDMDFQNSRLNLATHYACIKTMGALNELDWLCLDGPVSHYELNHIKSLAMAINDYLKNDEKDSCAREILLHIDHLKRSIDDSTPSLTFDASSSALFSMLAFTASLASFAFGLALVAGVASIGAGLIPTLAIGTCLTLFGFINANLSLDEMGTYSRLAFGEQFEELDQFAEALSQQHHILIEKKVDDDTETSALQPAMDH